MSSSTGTSGGTTTDSSSTSSWINVGDPTWVDNGVSTSWIYLNLDGVDYSVVYLDGTQVRDVLENSNTVFRNEKRKYVYEQFQVYGTSSSSYSDTRYVAVDGYDPDYRYS